MIEEADVVSDWQRPGYDVAASTIGVFDGDLLIAYAELSGGDRGDAAVDPAYRGAGIGTFLATWMQEQARARGLHVIGMPVPKGSSGDRLLEHLGYRIRWTSWALALPEGRVIEARTPSRVRSGPRTRPTIGESGRSSDAFLEWAVRDRQSFEDFSAQILQRPGFEPWNLRVVTNGNGEVLGAALILLADEVGFVERIAVRNDQRGLGLGQLSWPARLRRPRKMGLPGRSSPRIPYRCARPLRERGDGGDFCLGEPGHRSLIAGAWRSSARPVL